MHHLESKVESYVYRCLNFQVNYEVAPAVRPILSVDMLTNRRIIVLFVEGINSFIQLPHGHKNSHGQRKWSKSVKRDVG